MSDVQPRPKPSRRTVVGGAAWAVPAVALAVPAPVSAASGKAALEWTGHDPWSCDSAASPNTVSTTISVALVGGPLATAQPVTFLVALLTDPKVSDCWVAAGGTFTVENATPTSGTLPPSLSITLTSDDLVQNNGDTVKFLMTVAVPDYCCAPPYVPSIEVIASSPLASPAVTPLSISW